MTTLLFDSIAAPRGAPFGDVQIVVDDGKLVALDFKGFEARMHRLLVRRYAAFTFVRRTDPCGFSSCLRRYFDGALDQLDAIAVDTGGTPFQQAAWAALRTIPPGLTATYGEQANRIGKPRAVRAIGAANGRNPVCIVVPCHRVVGAGGALTGYAGGIDTKRWLLRHEGALHD